MNLSKEQIEQEIAKAKKGQLIFFILSMAFIGITVALIIVSIILGAKNSSGDAWYVYGYSAGMSMCIAVTFLIIRSVFFSTKIKALQMLQENHTTANIHVAPEVTARPVEPVEKSREEKLVEQYENLLKQGIITQEEFEAKKAEILKK